MIAIAIDAILGLVVVEGVVLVLVRHLTGRGLQTAPLIANLAAGFFLMLATRLALGRAGDGAVALCLLAALLAHVADLTSRWPR